MLFNVYKCRLVFFTLLILFCLLLLQLSFLPITAAADWDSKQNDAVVVGQLGEILRCSEGVTLEEYVDSTTGQFSLGSATADAMRLLAKTDIAIYNGGELYRNILSGPVTWGTIKSAYTTQQQLGVASITPKDLYEILEYGFSYIQLNAAEQIDHSNSSFDGFPQISGFSVEYDVSALPFERIRKIALSDGRTLDRNDDATIITLSATTYMLKGGYEYPAVEYTTLEATQAEALAEYINSGISEKYADETGYRQKAVGTDDNRFIVTTTERFVLLVSVVGIGFIISMSTWRKYAHRKNLDEYIDSHESDNI